MGMKQPGIYGGILFKPCIVDRGQNRRYSWKFPGHYPGMISHKTATDRVRFTAGCEKMVGEPEADITQPVNLLPKEPHFLRSSFSTFCVKNTGENLRSGPKT